MYFPLVSYFCSLCLFYYNETYYFLLHSLAFSDISIQLSDRTFPGHRFVLATRSSHWSLSDETLNTTDTLDLSHLSPHVAVLLLRWVYTDAIFLPSDQTAIIELLSATNQYQLKQLKEKYV